MDRKALNWALGILGAIVITGSVYFPSKISRLKEENKEISLEKEKDRVNNYNKVVVKYNSLVKRFNNRGTLNKRLIKKNLELRKNTVSLKAYKNKINEYQAISDSLGFFKEGLNLENEINSELEKILKQKKDSINLLSLNVDSLEKDLIQYDFLFNSQKDTTNLLQKYLNIYVVNKSPIKEKHENKVYLPENEFFLPKNKEEIRGIKALNKKYRKSNSTKR